MDGSASIGLEQALLGHSLGFAPFAAPTQVYVSLCLASTVPSETVPGLEASGGGYARMPATFALIAGPSNIAANTTSIEFPQALSSWGQIGFFELWDAPNGGNRLYWGQLVSTTDFTTPLVLQVSAGDITRFSAGTLGVQASTGAGGTASIGAYLPLAGGQMGGPLLLSHDPTASTEAATKSYVDAHSGTGGGPGFLPLSGGQMLGPLNYTATGGTTPRSAQDRSADVANVLDFGAVANGTTDCTAAFVAALATGDSVYAPRGSYLLRNQLTLSNGQELYGDGRGLTTLLIDQTFSSSATCVISLTGQEQFAPAVRDLAIQFAQPSDQGSRANFKTLAAGGTSGTGGTGVMYPPAIGLTTANRFKLRNLRISRAWDGIITMGSNPIGGFFIRDIEMSALNCGLALDNVLDFGHVVGYHMWAFDMSTTLLHGVWWDGLTFAAKLGTASVTGGGGGNFTDFAAYDSRVQIANSGSMVQFQGLSMDGNNSTLEISNCLMCQISNAYFSGGPTNSNPSTAQLNVTGGNVFMSNTYFQAGASKPAIFQSGGRLVLSGGEVLWSTNNATVMTQTGGRSYITGVAFAPAPTGVWTVPLISVTGAALISFHSNIITNTSVGDVGGLVIATDATQNSVSGNFWNGWGFTLPGPLGDYGLNSANGAWGQQLVLGTIGQAGRIDFRRGVDGAAHASIGYAAATGNNNVDLTTLSGGSLARLNGQSGDVFLVNNVEMARVDTQGVRISQRPGAAIAPGATFGQLVILAGTTAGTARLAVYAGTSTTPVIIADNIGAGF